MINIDSNTQNVVEIRNTIKNVLEIPLERIHYNPVKRKAVIELKRNRHVTICTHQLETLKREFACEDIIISSPYRCVLELKFWTKKDNHKCCHCRRKDNE